MTGMRFILTIPALPHLRNSPQARNTMPIGSRSDKSQSQTGKNSTAHLAGFGHPLYGKTASPTTGMATPSITMKPAFSVVKVNVTNKTDTDLAVSSISFTATESVVGTFFIDFSGTEATYGDGQYVSSTAKLSVSGDATIESNASADFYLAVKPFTATGGSTLKISVNGYEKSLTTTDPVTFAEGKVKKVNFSYDKVPVAEVKTYQHIFTTKPSTGTTTLSGVNWDISAEELGNYNSKNYAGVQFGTSKKVGSITLASSSSWSYNGATQVKEIRVWMNTGDNIDPATVTIGGVEASTDDTVSKNSNAGNDYTKASKITYTPASNGTTGIIVISATTKSKASYLCAIEIDCE